MKKMLSIIISITILLLFFSFSAFAQNPVTLSIQDERVYAGDTFTVNVFISDNSMVSGAVIDINYDNKMLEFISAKEGGILDTNGTISIRNILSDKSCVRFAYMSNISPIESEGILFTITFKALETAKGSTNLEITIPTPADFVNSNLEKIEYKVENAEILILENISIDTMESTIAENTTEEEIISEIMESETESMTINTDENSNTNGDNSKILLLVLLLVGLALICFGVAFIVKKKK